jgi:aminoglycoside 3-N-acetyltransferase
MTESDAIDRVDEPVTTASLVEHLGALGLGAGDTVMLHSSLSALGWVAGGPQAVVDAFRSVLTRAGTLVMPTHTGQYSDPADWEHPPVPDHWVETIRASMPPYRPAVTPARGMGAIPECFRDYPDVVRSRHPLYSFAAWGADADAIVADHGFDRPLGEASPLARLYDLAGDVLLLGVGHEVNTSLHLAEYRTSLSPETTTERAPVLEDGERRLVEYEDIEKSTDDFPDLGAVFERRVGLEEGAVGAATAKLAPQRALVDFAVDWFEAK